MVIKMVEYISYEVKDRSLAYGSLKGDVPFAGTFRDGDVDREIRGGLQWKTRLPDSNPEEGMLNVSMIMFVDNMDIGPSPCGRMRLESGLVSHLNANDEEAGKELLGMLLEKTGNVGRFDVHPVHLGRRISAFPLPSDARCMDVRMDGGQYLVPETDMLR